MPGWPSNHLDAEARAWLLQWLQAAQRTVVVVSHDRQLLRCVDCMAELSPRGLARYGGNDTLYRAQRDAAMARQRREQVAHQRRQARGRRIARTANLPTARQSSLARPAREAVAEYLQRYPAPTDR